MILVVTAMAVSPGAVGAREFEARSYANIPIGLNFFAVGSQYSWIGG